SVRTRPVPPPSPGRREWPPATERAFAPAEARPAPAAELPRRREPWPRRTRRPPQGRKTFSASSAVKIRRQQSMNRVDDPVLRAHGEPGGPAVIIHRGVHFISTFRIH